MDGGGAMERKMLCCGAVADTARKTGALELIEQ